MPCYDKKLEASRPDFATPYAGTSSAEPVRDVDCVLTTGEVERMLADKGLDLGALATEARSHVDATGQAEGAYVPSYLVDPSPGTSSGGYVHNALRAVMDTLNSDQRSRASVVEKRVRSDDYVEYSLVDTDSGHVYTRAVKCYGFRNLQNIVRKIGKDKGVAVTRGAAGRYVRRSAVAASDSKGKSKEVEVEFVEVMACPGGCVNGGGQVAPPKTSRRKRKAGLDDEGMPDVSETIEAGGDDERVLSPKEWVASVERRYWGDSQRADGETASETRADAVGRVVERLLRGDKTNARRSELLRTSYRAVESEEINGLAVKW